MPSSDEIGKAKIVVEADVTGLKKDLKDAKSNVEDFGNEAESSSNKAADGLKGVGSAADSVAAKLSKVTGIIGAFAAAITGVVNAFNALKEYFRDGEELADEFKKGIDSIGNAEGALEKLNQKIIEVGAELNRLESSPLTIFGRNKEQIEEELEALRKTRLSISRQVKIQREREAKETADAFIEAAKKIQEQVEISLLPSEEQVRANAEIQKQQLIKAAEEARVEIDNAALQSALDAIDRKAKAEIEAERKVVAERERLENERIEKQAEREAKMLAAAIERELTGVFAALTTSFGTGFTTQLGAITGKIDEAVDELRKVKRGR